MRQKKSQRRNFLPLWPDEMTKGCTAKDFVPGEEEGGVAYILKAKKFANFAFQPQKSA